MYDSHIYSSEYKDLKDMIVDIINGDDIETDVQELSDHIQELYEEGKLSSSMYDDLSSYLQDLL